VDFHGHNVIHKTDPVLTPKQFVKQIRSGGGALSTEGNDPGEELIPEVPTARRVRTARRAMESPHLMLADSRLTSSPVGRGSTAVATRR